MSRARDIGELANPHSSMSRYQSSVRSEWTNSGRGSAHAGQSVSLDRLCPEACARGRAHSDEGYAFTL
jgi:hypothetical protein